MVVRTRQAVSLIQSLQKGQYQVFLVAPETFTSFTPLLPCESRSLHHLIHQFTYPNPSCCRGNRPDTDFN